MVQHQQHQTPIMNRMDTLVNLQPQYNSNIPQPHNHYHGGNRGGMLTSQQQQHNLGQNVSAGQYNVGGGGQQVSGHNRYNNGDHVGGVYG